MEFDDILVKESPGLCRCCLSEGCYKDLGKEYTWMNENEVYADMLLECFDISISQHNEGPNGPNRLICEVCITRLRDACNFKKQVLDSEKKFIDMVGRGEFRPKVLIYQAQMKAENEEVVDEVAEVEYLEDDMEFGDDELIKPSDNPEPSVSEDITVTALPVKNKRGRPKKNASPVKPEKKKKLEDKARTSKAIVKATRPKSHDIRIPTEIDWLKASLRHHIEAVLRNTTIMPFKWRCNKYCCFYCCLLFDEASKLREHTRNHIQMNIAKFIVDPLSPIKIDVSYIECLKCNSTLSNIDEVLEHLKEHCVLDDVDRKCFVPFRLDDDEMKCLLCEEKFKFFGKLCYHTNKEHLEETKRICEVCGEVFFSGFSLKKHQRIYHLQSEYKCRVCEATFKIESNRFSHELKEHDIRTFKCFKCPEIFGSEYLRKYHMSSVHSTSQFACDQCPKMFLQKCLLFKHYERVHLKQKNFN